MKIGYPTINLALGCTSAHTFRLASWSPERQVETARRNIACLERTLAWNVQHGLRFFRISSGLVPFGSVNRQAAVWPQELASELTRVGDYIRAHGLRISLHPGQYAVLNSPSPATYAATVAELEYHADVLALMGLGREHKVQIHLGGLHGDAQASTRVFIERYLALHERVRQHLVIENDERMASVEDCAALSRACGVPVLFDTLHHQVRNNGETLLRGLDKAMATWTAEDGVPMVDYSNQDPDKRVGAHAQTLDVERFRSFGRSLRGRDVDIMCEIKNKEGSALQALAVVETEGIV